LPQQTVTAGARVLTVNAGSSSIKLALFAAASEETRLAYASVERIADHATALREALAPIRTAIDAAPLDAIAHRIVHGGDRYRDPQPITSDVIAALQQLAPLDPEHMPQTLTAIDLMAMAFPDTPQIACFDTAFHRSLPPVAQMYALPRRFRDAGVRRYGFHGLSCEYIMDALRRLGLPAESGRVIIAHLGSGASLTAVRDGESVETTMGFSPTGGVVMGTRTGDLDPGVVLYALRHDGADADALSRLVNRDAGLLAVSETSQDMRDLLARESADSRARDAVTLFCYTVKKAIGSLVAVLGGLDTLVFTAGIGEHAPPIRQRICTGLEIFGIELDQVRNLQGDAVISAQHSAVTVRVVATDEDRMLARHARTLLAGGDRHV
jgi:acetate kinase